MGRVPPPPPLAEGLRTRAPLLLPCRSNRQVHKLYKSADVTSSFVGELRSGAGRWQAAAHG